ncbi:MAG: hypothetical protein LVS60_18385 [Nodosilinea sp. LVE1205-7]|jgi:SOS-response transcriptional repressor LexA
METSFPAATFIMRVEGDLVAGAAAQPGDLLILDRSRPPQPGSLMATLNHRLRPDAVKFAALGL